MAPDSIFVRERRRDVAIGAANALRDPPPSEIPALLHRYRGTLASFGFYLEANELSRLYMALNELPVSSVMTALSYLCGRLEEYGE